MSVIISGHQLLTLLLRGDFSPQYFPAIWDMPRHRRSTLKGRVEIKVTRAKRNTIRLRKPGCGSVVAALGRPRPPAAPMIAAHPGTGPSKKPLEAQKVPTAQYRLEATGWRRAPSPPCPGRALTRRRRRRCSASPEDRTPRVRGQPRAPGDRRHHAPARHVTRLRPGARDWPPPPALRVPIGPGGVRAGRPGYIRREGAQAKAAESVT